MAILKCTQCSQIHKQNFLWWSLATTGWTGFSIGGLGLMPLIRPFVTRIYKTFPKCGKLAWIKVLRGKDKEKCS
jgi:hypothetical protein